MLAFPTYALYLPTTHIGQEEATTPLLSVPLRVNTVALDFSPGCGNACLCADLESSQFRHVGLEPFNLCVRSFNLCIRLLELRLKPLSVPAFIQAILLPFIRRRMVYLDFLLQFREPRALLAWGLAVEIVRFDADLRSLQFVL